MAWRRQRWAVFEQLEPHSVAQRSRLLVQRSLPELLSLVVRQRALRH